MQIAQCEGTRIQRDIRGETTLVLFPVVYSHGPGQTAPGWGLSVTGIDGTYGDGSTWTEWNLGQEGLDELLEDLAECSPNIGEYEHAFALARAHHARYAACAGR